uniref:High mobility group nucleosomal binding domain 2 n=1 Tax=Pipistrellus kuhlii TaxID=59472 RepID=A0A7J7W3E2_PIPKU|nr:high mobility group nucleosomal binding domain 2 [Pipistrellus kuhlii]
MAIPEGDAEGNKAKVNHREELPGYQLTPLLQSQSPSLKRSCKEGREGTQRDKADTGKDGNNPAENGDAKTDHAQKTEGAAGGK